MPLYKDISLMQQVHIGIWKVEETIEQLYQLVPFAAELKAQTEMKNQCTARQIEFVAVRVLLYYLLNNEKVIAYHPSGRPYITDQSHYISISHTKGYVALALSAKAPIGVDIECYGTKIIKVKQRIVGSEEYAESIYELLLHWSAKESVYKVLDVPGVDFIKHLKVKHLQCRATELKPQDEGMFKLEVALPATKGVLDIAYYTEADFVLTCAGNFAII